jgi:protein-tyrosine phosphatase
MAKKIGTDVECIRIPIPDLTSPTPALMVTILDRIDQAISQEKPIFVHCWGGKGRTGSVVGCFLARHGKASGQDALKRIVQLRCNDPKSHERSPETHDQRAMVRSWGKGK